MSHNGQQSVNLAVKSICDIMRRGNCKAALQYVPELTWILFLRILDERETDEAEKAMAQGTEFTPSIERPYRWQDWAAPKSKLRDELAQKGEFKVWVNEKLLPHLKSLKDKPQATSRQKVISEVMSAVEKVRIDTQRNLLDVLDKVHDLKNEHVDKTHVFTLSQVYEGLLLKLGEKKNDGGQFFTPREVIRAMVRVVDPKIGETVYDPGCGTGGFLAQAFEYTSQTATTGTDLHALKEQTYFGRESDDLTFPISLANLVLHGIDRPNIWHGNTLTGHETYGGLFTDAPERFKVVLMNPPFGGKEGKEAQTNFAFKTGKTQLLFLQHIMSSLTADGRAGIVVDEGILFQTAEKAFLQTKKKLLEEFDLWCIVSLPGGVFSAAGAGVKTDLLFFNKGTRTERIWYYDLSHIKVGKKSPLTLAHFEAFCELLPDRADSENSWTIDIRQAMKDAEEESKPVFEEAAKKESGLPALVKAHKAAAKQYGKNSKQALAAEVSLKEMKSEVKQLKARASDILASAFDLKAVNPNRKPVIDTRTPTELIALIREKNTEIERALAAIEAICD